MKFANGDISLQDMLSCIKPVSGTAAAAAPAVDPDVTMKSIVSHLIHFKINEIKV